MKPTWYVQSSIDITAHDKIFDICEELTLPFISVPIIPFSTELPAEVDFSAPGIPYGSTTFIDLCSKHSTLKHYTFTDKTRLTCCAYYQKLGKDFVNEPLYIGDIKNIPEFDICFLKSNQDSKAICGDVYTLEQIKELKKNCSAGFDSFLSDGLVVYCSTPKTVVDECRLVFMGGEYLTGSTYNVPYKGKKRELNIVDDKDVIDFAKKCIALYNPFYATVIDIGFDVDAQELKCIEYNCFNSSGWYACDWSAILSTLSTWVEKCK